MAKLDRGILFRQLDRLYRDGTFTAQSDAQLLERYLLRGDEAAFEALVNLHGPMVLSLCRRFLRDPRDIEDAFQATFLILARRASSIRKREVLSSWLYGVAYRVAVRSRSDVLRRRSYEIASSSVDDAVQIDSNDLQEVVPILDQELSRLPEKLRAPLVLCYLKDCTHDQAAAELRWPVGTVRSRLARGRELLRERLTRRGCAPTAAILGASPKLSRRPFTAAVPPALVHSTVQAANRFASAALAGTAGQVFFSSFSGSATTLAQGVLTTMVLSQIKMFGAGLIAAGLVGGSFGAGAWALASPRQDPAPRQVQPPLPVAPAPVPVRGAVIEPPPPAATPAPPTMHYQVMQDNTPAASGLGAVERRLDQLERKLDLLLQQRLGDVNPAVYPSQSPSSRKQNMPMRPFLRAPSSNPPATQPPPLPPPGIAAENVAALAPQPAPRQETSPFVSAPAPTLAPAAEPLPPPPSSGTPGLPSTPELAQTEPANQPLQPLPAPREARSEPAQAPPPEVQIPAETGDAVTDPFRPSRARSDFLGGYLSNRTSAREIDAQLGVAIRRSQRASRLLEKKAISREEYETLLDDIRLLVGRLKGLIDDLSDEIERSSVELLRKQEEIRVAEAREAATAAVVKRNARLNERKPGMVAPEEVAKAEAETHMNAAQITVKGREVSEVELRIKQLQKRRAMLAQTLEETTASLRSSALDEGRTATNPAQTK
jgi:RNA polymerase sigma factor (sigma-70 family)